MKNKFFVIHGHFYQPLRVDPWYNTTIRESDSCPYHNWNQKITDECYGPNAINRILLKNKDELVSNYTHISFNFGPTLFNWIEEHYPDLYVAILEADRISAKIFGQGNAIAQVYNHQIMPLATLRDKKIQIKWGKEFFKAKFKREPIGMWLSELAVDNETLECLIEQGIKFTILSPHQAKYIFNKDGNKAIENNNFDILKPYKWYSQVNKDKFINIFFYDRNISSKIMSELENADKFFLRIYSRYNSDKEKQILSIASYGENYGHHLKKGDIYLTNLINKILKDKKVQLINFSAFLNSYDSKDIIGINENTSWSCPHGIGRWKENCGCRYNKNLNDQSWRSRLREIFDNFSNKIDELFFSEGIKYFKNPEEALEEYIYYLLYRSPEEKIRFIHNKAGKHLNPIDTRNAILLLEMQKSKFLMYMSCGWFFDDITNRETLIIVKHFIKVCEIAKRFGMDFSSFINEIKKIKSNFKKVDFSFIIDDILKNHYTPLKAAVEFSISNMLGYFQPFDTHCDYKYKVIKEKKSNNFYFSIILITSLSTLEQDEFFVSLKNEAENIFYKVRKISNSEKEMELEKLAQSGENFEIGDLSFLPEEKKEIFNSFIKKDEKSKLIREFLIKLSRIDFSFENSNSIFEYLVMMKDKNLKDFEIPFIYETIKFLLIEFVKYENKNQKEITKWIEFISNSEFKSLLWKRDLIKQKDIIKI